MWKSEEDGQKFSFYGNSTKPNLGLKLDIGQSYDQIKDKQVFSMSTGKKYAIQKIRVFNVGLNGAKVFIGED